jgi:cytochrome c oxidase assembly factor CtaG
MQPLLVIAIGCLVLFIIALRARRAQGSMWPLIQNISALLGIASFLMQIFHWRSRRR